MNRFVKLLLIVAGVAGTFVAVRALVAKYAAIIAAAVAVWNDPEVKKIRRRAAKHLEKARKSAEKAARKAVKS